MTTATAASGNTQVDAGKVALQHAAWLLDHARVLRNLATTKFSQGSIGTAGSIMDEVSKTEKRAQELLEFAANYPNPKPTEGPYR